MPLGKSVTNTTAAACTSEDGWIRNAADCIEDCPAACDGPHPRCITADFDGITAGSATGRFVGLASDGGSDFSGFAPQLQVIDSLSPVGCFRFTERTDLHLPFPIFEFSDDPESTLTQNVIAPTHRVHQQRWFDDSDELYHLLVVWEAFMGTIFVGHETYEELPPCDEEVELPNLLEAGDVGETVDLSDLVGVPLGTGGPNNGTIFAASGGAVAIAYGGTVTLTPGTCICFCHCGPDCYDGQIGFTIGGRPFVLLGGRTNCFSWPKGQILSDCAPDLIMGWGSYSVEPIDGVCTAIIRISVFNIDGSQAGQMTWHGTPIGPGKCRPVAVEDFTLVETIGNFPACTGEIVLTDITVEPPPVDPPDPADDCPTDCSGCDGALVWTGGLAFTIGGVDSITICLSKRGCVWIHESENAQAIAYCAIDKWTVEISVTKDAEEIHCVLTAPLDGSPCPPATGWTMESYGGATSSAPGFGNPVLKNRCSGCAQCADADDPFEFCVQTGVIMAGSAYTPDWDPPECATGDRGDFIIPASWGHEMSCEGSVLSFTGTPLVFPCGDVGNDITVEVFLECTTSLLLPESTNKALICTITYSGPDLDGTLVFEEIDGAMCPYDPAANWQLVSNDIPDFTPGTLAFTTA